MLDGEGGYTVYGKLFQAKKSLEIGGVPLGLAHNVKLLRDVSGGHPLTWDDVQMETGLAAYQVRKEMESVFQ